MAVTDGDVIRCAVNIALPDLVIAQNIWYWQLEDSVPNNPTNAQVVTSVDNELTALYEDIEAVMTDGATVLDADIDRVEWEIDHWENKENVGIATLAIVGNDAVNDMAPHGCAVVVTANTPRPQTRARKFFPGIVESAFLDSDLGGTILTALTQLGIEWLSGRLVTGSAELVPVVLGQSGASAGLVYPLVSAIVNGLVGYQRRRKPGVGS